MSYCLVINEELRECSSGKITKSIKQGSSIALNSLRHNWLAHEVAKNNFRTKLERTSLSTQCFRWRCVLGAHPYPSRTRWLRPKRPMILGWRRPGKAGGCRIFIWGISSVGRAPALQAGGREFESRILQADNEDCLQLNDGPEGTAISKWACSSGG